MTRAAMLAALIAGIAMQPAAAEPFDIAVAPARPAPPPPSQLRDKGRAGFSDYLSASPHRAFAVSPKGAFAVRSGRRSTREAAEAALTACAEYAPDCTLYAVDDHLAETANAGSR
jgi:hypothetical protein